MYLMNAVLGAMEALKFLQRLMRLLFLKEILWNFHVLPITTGRIAVGNLVKAREFVILSINSMKKLSAIAGRTKKFFVTKNLVILLSLVRTEIFIAKITNYVKLK